MTAARTTISKHYRRRGRSTAAFHHSAPTTTQTAGTTAICSASVSYLSTLKNYFQDSCQADYLKIYRTTGLIELWLRMTNLKLVFSIRQRTLSWQPIFTGRQPIKQQNPDAGNNRVVVAECRFQKKHKHAISSTSTIWNESEPMQLAQCRFPGLAISNAKI